MKKTHPALVLAGLVICTPAWAASPSDVGSWGDAWGDTASPTPTAASPRPARTEVPRTPLPTAPAVSPSPLPSGPRPADVGGWGDAWGSDPVRGPADPSRAG
ncbi:MAG: hypothetical protein LDL39_13090, partial [Magnetospirillum sp.]|nr:hypothetical protein [Magnetospirillum sp.]